MPKKMKNGGNKYAFRQLKGTSLADVDKDRRKNGCKDPNSPTKRFYGLTEASIGVKPTEFTCVSQFPGSREMKVTMKFFTVEVTYWAITTLCLPAEKAKLSLKARSEWDRFEKEVVKHEAKHFDDAKVLAELLGDEVMKMTATGKGKTLEEAGEDGKKRLMADFKKKYAGSEIEKRINKAMKARDSVDGHGSGSGAKLNLSVA